MTALCSLKHKGYWPVGLQIQIHIHKATTSHDFPFHSLSLLTDKKKNWLNKKHALSTDLQTSINLLFKS